MEFLFCIYCLCLFLSPNLLHITLFSFCLYFPHFDSLSHLVWSLCLTWTIHESLLCNRRNMLNSFLAPCTANLYDTEGCPFHSVCQNCEQDDIFLNVFWGKCMYLFISQQSIFGLNSVHHSLQLACFQKQAQLNRGVTLFDQCHIKEIVAAICYETYRITWLPSWPLRSLRSLQKNTNIKHLKFTETQACVNMTHSNSSPFLQALQVDLKALVYPCPPEKSHKWKLADAILILFTIVFIQPHYSLYGLCFQVDLVSHQILCPPMEKRDRLACIWRRH